MKLNLVERRRRPRQEPDPWAAGRRAWPACAALAAGLGVPGWRIDVVLLDDTDMAELNRDFRGGDGVTDVLSFSYLESEGPGDPDLPAGGGEAAVDLWVEALTPAEADAATVGELVLAPAFVDGRCRRMGWDVDHEWPLLVVHGCLHVLGWIHDTAPQREAMQAVEARLLAGQGLPHPLRERS
ncbi:MAG: rRNA maturation RNase YbeY [Candidatus Krumholzibacteriia bacterium]